MNRRIALLRGINVGKQGRIAMKDLVACTEAAGCADVRTVLATGNVLVTDPRSTDELRAVLESAYAEQFGYTAVVQVLTCDAVEAAVEAYPFESLDEHHDYVVLSDDPAVTERVVHAMGEAIEHVRAEANADAETETETEGTVPGPAISTEAVAAGPGCVHWRVPKGSTLASKAGKVLDARENKLHLTTRNIRTLRKILAAG